MTRGEFCLMVCEALTRIGMNVPSLKGRYARLESWSKNAARNRVLLATRGPASVAVDLEAAAGSGEPMGTLLPSYLRSIAANLRRAAELGEDFDGISADVPDEIPEREIRSIAFHLKRLGQTVCRGEYLERHGADGIRAALLERGLDADVSESLDFFEPMTFVGSAGDGTGYTVAKAARPTVVITLSRRGSAEGARKARNGKRKGGK